MTQMDMTQMDMTQMEEIESPSSSPERELISAFVITFNEEDNIRACLESLSFCDEIVVVDSFSTDRTVAIAESLGARVVQHPWSGYRDQKAYGLGLVSNEWVLNVDADERVSPELRKNIEQVLVRARSEQMPNGYYINRVVFFLGRWWRRGGWYPEYRVRLFKRSCTKWGGTNPHEKPIVTGALDTISGELEHYTYRSMDEQFSRLHNFSSIMAAEDFKQKKRFSLFKLLGNPVLRFFKFYIVKQGFKEGIAGLIVALNESFYTYMKYAKLWESYFLAQQSRKDETLKEKETT